MSRTRRARASCAASTLPASGWRTTRARPAERDGGKTMFETLITGGTIVNADEERKADLAIADGRIAAILPAGETVTANCVVDASGCLLLPGLFDVHAHLREPGP